ADGVLGAPNGRFLLFTSEVFPECADDECNRATLALERTEKVKARIYTSLLYRHWNEWRGARRKHLLLLPLDGGPVRDLTPGNRDVPTFSLGGPDDYAIASDSGEICYVSNTEPEPALSTNTDLFTVPAGGGEPKKITIGLGSERSPAYSPDGNFIAYRSQERAGYESDRWRLTTLERNTGAVTILNEAQDRPVASFAWHPDSLRLFYTTEDRGRTTIQMIAVTGGSTRAVITGSSHMDDIQFAPDGKTMIYSEQSGSRPAEIFRASASGGAAVPLTRLNENLLSQYELPALQEFWVERPEVRVHSFLLMPPGFQAGRKYPVLFLIHGGPQGAWGESWSYRWNAQVFAGAGYVVVMPNPRGSTGYGQKFTDDINQDWGGKPYDDILAVVDHIAAHPYADTNRLAAAGGSYGGYMVNWMLGHTDRFRAFVSHAGVYDLASMVGETEELWFPMWEFRSMPWDNPELYSKLSPSTYVQEFQTPTLVTHGELDYRVPLGQGLQLFTALQLMKVPSKLVVFPDEGHWILKPQNSALWYRTVLEWIGEWTTKRPAAAPAEKPVSGTIQD
ncbi:MAG: prolyl oligopeptidase family serine peptidase, partial [Bryobacteraceae bacterium]